MVNFFIVCSVWIIVVMGIDRFIFVKCLIWFCWRNWKLKIQIKIFVVIIFFIIICVLKFFCYEIIENGLIVWIWDFEFCYSLFFWYIEIVFIGVFYFFLLVILFVVNIYFVKKFQLVCDIKKEMKLLNFEYEMEWQKFQQIFIVILVSIVILFIIFIFLVFIVDVVMFVDFIFIYFWIMRNLLNLLLWCNLLFNCFLYCIFNRQYFKVLRYVIDRGCDCVRCLLIWFIDFQMVQNFLWKCFCDYLDFLYNVVCCVFFIEIE